MCFGDWRIRSLGPAWRGLVQPDQAFCLVRVRFTLRTRAQSFSDKSCGISVVATAIHLLAERGLTAAASLQTIARTRRPTRHAVRRVHLGAAATPRPSRSVPATMGMWLSEAHLGPIATARDMRRAQLPWWCEQARAGLKWL
jgi:hypothetical protein